MKVISRNEIPAIEKINVKGADYSLGKHMDFRRNEVLKKFLPVYSRISVSWVNLKKGQTLEVHHHPTSSMIIICEGEGKVSGDVKQSLKTGDIVIVPPNYKHGFTGTGKEGFWALSIQFEGEGLYEDLKNPRVKFVENQNKDDFSLLEKDQKFCEVEFGQSAFMQLMKSKKVKDEQVRERLLEGLNYWSNWFQRILARRMAAGGGIVDKYQELAEDHFQEEVGHNKQVAEMRHQHQIKLWDPILDSCCTWFYEKMISGNAHEKVVLVHFVMEAASVIFHQEAVRVFPKSTYFDLHNAVDDEHYDIGVKILKEDPTINISKLRETLKKGWEVFDLLTSRIAYYAEKGKSGETKNKAKKSKK